jgi:hypothetical protein
MKYVIEAKNIEDAENEVADMVEKNDDFFESVVQSNMGEIILDSREISKKEFNEILQRTEKNKTGSYWMGDKLIRKVKYDKK